MLVKCFLHEVLRSNVKRRHYIAAIHRCAVREGDELVEHLLPVCDARRASQFLVEVFFQCRLEAVPLRVVDADGGIRHSAEGLFALLVFHGVESGNISLFEVR